MDRNPLQEDYVNFPARTRGGPELAAHIANSTAKGVYDLKPRETFWRDVYYYLQSKGYQLRPRYHPGWKAPWIGTDIFPRYFEESRTLVLPRVIDARRESDNEVVAIKWIPNEEHTRNEIDVLRYISSDELRADPRNHCNPLLDSFAHPHEPSGIFIVTPWLDDLIGLPLEYVHDLVEMMLQLFEGLIFLHEHRIAHRDCTGWNILQDARSAFPGKRCHPLVIGASEDMQTRYSALPRCMCNFRYYFIDFGISTRFEGPGPYRVTGTIGRDPTPLELSDDVPYDPFKLDVYLLGNHFLQAYVLKCTNLSFLIPLLLLMTHPEPQQRPSAQRSLQLLRQVATEPAGLQFRWRLRRKADGWMSALALDIRCIFREIYLQARHVILGTSELSFGYPL